MFYNRSAYGQVLISIIYFIICKTWQLLNAACMLAYDIVMGFSEILNKYTTSPPLLLSLSPLPTDLVLLFLLALRVLLPT